MPIVDFEQDPNAPYGSGNFRDETGKTTYLHDPDTASQFNKTMKGSAIQSQVGGESDAIATRFMGGAAPGAGPDMRLAMNDTGQPVPVGDVTAPAPPPPNTVAPPMASDAENMSVAPPEPLSSSPSAPGAAPSKPQQLVDAVSKVHAKAPAADLPPISGTSNTHNTAVVHGRPAAAVDADIAAREKAGGVVDEQLLTAGREKDTATDRALGAQGSAATLRAMREQTRIDAAKAERQKAVEDRARVQEALKKNDESLDPEHYMRTMSTGKRVSMTILAALNGAFGALIGQKGNGVIDVLNKSIDADIDRQKQEIASGRIRMGNDIQEFINQGHDAKTAEALARDRLDAAVDQVTEIEAKRLGIAGENEKNAQLFVAQRQEARAAQRGELLAQKESKIQESDSAVVERSVPKPTNGIEQLLQIAQLESANLKLNNDRIASADATELSGELYGTDENGRPLKLMNPDQVKEVKDKVAQVGPALAETAGAVNMTKALVEALGGKLDETTGKITKPEGGDLKGVGPVDKRGGYTGAITAVPRALGLYRADIDRARDAQNALKEYVTKQMTGANSNLRQDQTFGSMVGGDFSNEEQTWENLQNWTDTLFASVHQHMGRLGSAGMRLMGKNQSEAKRGNGAPPLKERVTTGARGTSVIPDEPQTMSVNP